MHPFFDAGRPLVMGHRGAAGEAPENTLTSFERALSQGAQVLESDLHATGDGTLVLLHDDTLDRTTEGSGPVWETTWGELRKLDAGYRFSPAGEEGFPYRGQGIRIPSLAEAFEALPEARFNLEIKQAGPGIVRRVVETVARAGRAERTLLTSADDAIMGELRVVLEETGVGAAVGASTSDVAGFVRSALQQEKPPPGPMALQVPDVFAGRPLVTPEFVRHAHAHGVQIHVWTVNHLDTIETMLDLDVDGLVTDFPARVAAAVARRERR